MTRAGDIGIVDNTEGLKFADYTGVGADRRIIQFVIGKVSTFAPRPSTGDFSAATQTSPSLTTMKVQGFETAAMRIALERIATRRQRVIARRILLHQLLASDARHALPRNIRKGWTTFGAESS